VVFVPDRPSPTQELRKLVPERPSRSDAVFNMGRVAEWILAVRNRDGRLLRTAMEDRLHQPGRASAYPYLQPMIAAAREAGALGAALSGAGGGVIAIVDGSPAGVAAALGREAQRLAVGGSVLSPDAVGGRRFR
jgi:homoserine kinase